MAKVSLFLDTRNVSKSGLYPIKVRVTNNNTNAARSTDILISEKDWDDGTKRLVRNASNARKINDYLNDLIFEYNSCIILLNRNARLRNMRATDIISYVERGDTNSSIDPFFNSRIEDYANQCRKQTTKTLFLYTEKTVMDYVRTKDATAKNVFLTDINYDFLCRFDRWMENKGMKKNTRAINMTNIRTIWNKATKSKDISRDCNPFYGEDGYKIDHALKKKEYLPIEGMRKLMELDFRGVQGCDGLEKARDFFLLSFFLCGISPIDLYHLPKCKNGKIVYVRKKIEHHEPEPVNIFVPAAAKKIIDKYSDGPSMLNFDQHYMNFSSCYSFFRHRIDRIAKMIGYPGMTLYWSRYTWSTYAMKLGASNFVVDKLQGRMPFSINEKHYASFEWEDGIEIINKVIAYTTEGVNYNSVKAPKYVL